MHGWHKRSSWRKRLTRLVWKLILCTTSRASPSIREIKSKSLILLHKPYTSIAHWTTSAASFALNVLGATSACLGDYASARPYFEQSLSLCREIGDRRGEAIVLRNLGALSDSWGD